MEGLFMARKDRLIKVLVTEEEYARISKMAGEVPLSAFCRRLLARSPIADAARRPDAEMSSSNVPAKVVAKRLRFDSLPVVGEQRMQGANEVTCEHGKPRNYHCWQCGGVAKLGS
jgi:hypothetical protein